MRIVVAMILALVAGCAPKPAVPEKPLKTLDGTITYRQRIALSPDAIVKVWLQDVSKMDAVAEVLDEVEIRNPGQVPIAFRVRYDPDRIVEKHRYTLLVKIYEGDRTRFLNATSYPVITQGCTDRCEIVLDMMQ
ncbi:MAG: YbaY family lipoprotein [Burkholderiales bacterium]|nr:YbaY family lipoprotein [Burkholderiales bacterium]